MYLHTYVYIIIIIIMIVYQASLRDRSLGAAEYLPLPAWNDPHIREIAREVSELHK